MEFNFVLPEDFETQRVAQLLEELWLVPRKQRYFLREKKHFLLNGMPLTDFDRLVKKDDEIRLIFDDDDFSDLTVKMGKAELAEIPYEDEHLVIANKPEGMKTHGNSPDELALQNHVAAAVGQSVFVVHRLDVATSGAVLFAKNQFVLPVLSRMFEQNAIHREYLALVQGKFNQNTLTIDQPIGRDRHDKRKQIVSKSGKRAITHLTKLSDFKKNSLVKCLLDTGRTHQIRVHLSAAGHSIVGDSLYGNDNNEPRLMLHAHKIILQQPFSNKLLEISASSQTFDARCEQEKHY